MRFILIAAVAALAACASPSQPTTPPSTGGGTPVAVQPSGSFMSLLNAARAENGRGPVREDSRLSASAQGHAQDMQTQDFFGHTGSNGSSFSDRARAAGYTCARAENIASGQRTPAQVMEAWMTSSGHRRNILLSDVTEFGIGRTANNWVLVLGRGC
ncbi:CAP domain-containing protein [Pseudooctadecabacter jejudonensis]|uniref:Cysteine-rich secretory protein family protein n=1 Tax=Pseudooctadecabacter jejudonensis TaxID=1391910 RepID=A0A1Y5RQP4_9RHOB|nr:CAP domain-containing protein [Pseudooctadecabacter jejudonensis]SLN22763.1 Cysteine-rich secretory protein family protein [Pseudooctadecabacter jejudonensis]